MRRMPRAFASRPVSRTHRRASRCSAPRAGSSAAWSTRAAAVVSVAAVGVHLARGIRPPGGMRVSVAAVGVHRARRLCGYGSRAQIFSRAPSRTQLFARGLVLHYRNVGTVCFARGLVFVPQNRERGDFTTRTECTVGIRSAAVLPAKISPRVFTTESTVGKISDPCHKPRAAVYSRRLHGAYKASILFTADCIYQPSS